MKLLCCMHAGAYSVTVQDQHACSITASFLISEPPPLLVSPAAIQTTSCFSGANGSIDISVAGGVPSYTYQWSNGAATQNISNLPSGLYSVTVSDQNLCTATG